MFQTACSFVVGRGDRTRFWTDRWIDGQSPAQLAPALISFATGRGAKERTVADALHDQQWVKDIRGDITLQALAEFVNLWTTIQAQPPWTDRDDSFTWRLTTKGEYTPSSAYLAFFHGTTQMD